jgi:hypothetical protein
MSLLIGCFGIFVLGPLLCIPLVRIVLAHTGQHPRGLRTAVIYLLLFSALPVGFFLPFALSVNTIDRIKTIGGPPKSEYLRCDVRDPAVARASLVMKNERTEPLFLEKNMIVLTFSGMSSFNAPPSRPVVMQTEIVGSSSGTMPVYILPSGERMRFDLESRDPGAITKVRGLEIPSCFAQLTLNEMVDGVYPGKINLKTWGTVDLPQH